MSIAKYKRENLTEANSPLKDFEQKQIKTMVQKLDTPRTQNITSTFYTGFTLFKKQTFSAI